jgi:hypothetical protein
MKYSNNMPDAFVYEIDAALKDASLVRLRRAAPSHHLDRFVTEMNDVQRQTTNAFLHYDYGGSTRLNVLWSHEQEAEEHLLTVAGVLAAGQAISREVYSRTMCFSIHRPVAGVRCVKKPSSQMVFIFASGVP